MEIVINGKYAALKDGESFDYIAENRLFSDADAYTLTISFPLRGCIENQRIFGDINRADVNAGKVIFNAVIRSGDFTKKGIITVTEISADVIKCQFLEGRSEQNFDTSLDNIYINQLDLGNWPTAFPPLPNMAWRPAATEVYKPSWYTGQFFAVALPWVNNNSGNIQNCAVYNADEGSYSWSKSVKALSWQPYLLFIAEAIARAAGFTYNFVQWENSEAINKLICCNTLPAAWDYNNFAEALPHWTVKEFFQKLEPILQGEFDFDLTAKSISFNISDKISENLNPVVINDVVNDHQSEITADPKDYKNEYSEIKKYAYKAEDNNVWKFYSCKWFIDSWTGSIRRFATLQELLDLAVTAKGGAGYPHRGSLNNDLLYAEDVDAYYIFKAVSKTTASLAQGAAQVEHYQYRLVPINNFGGASIQQNINNSKEDEITTGDLEVIPATLDETDTKHGTALFLSPAEFQSSDIDTSFSAVDNIKGKSIDEIIKERFTDELRQPAPVQIISEGARDSKAVETYDRIYLAWWDGVGYKRGLLPFPYVDNLIISPDMTEYVQKPFSLRLNDKRRRNDRLHIPRINQAEKRKFSFLIQKGDNVPNPRAIYIICGKKYVCEKLTVKFSSRGLSQLIKGEFYSIIE